MKFDVSQPLLGLDGKPVVGLFGQRDNTPITYSRLFILVSANGLQNDTPPIKYARFKTGVKIASLKEGEIVDLSDDEISALKDVIGQGYTPTIYGRVVDFLSTEYVAPPPAAKEVAPVAALAPIEHDPPSDSAAA
jgi:hypothetical protein